MGRKNRNCLCLRSIPWQTKRNRIRFEGFNNLKNLTEAEMKRAFLGTLFKDDPSLIALTEQISQDRADLKISVSNQLYPLIISSLFQNLKKPMLIVNENPEKACSWLNDFETVLPVKSFFLPDWEILPHEHISPGKEIVSERLKILHDFNTGVPMIAFTSVQALMRKIPGMNSPLLEPVVLASGTRISLDLLSEKLVNMGYERVYQVAARGQFSVRGGIVDVFGGDAELPVRIEFFGDEVESIRSFSISTQRSIAPAESFRAFACHEIQMGEGDAQKLIDILKKLPEQTDQIREDIEKLERQQYFKGIERYMPFLYQDLATVTDFMPQDSIVIFDDREMIAEKADRFYEQQKEYLAEAISKGETVSAPASYFAPFDAIEFNLKTLDLSPLTAEEEAKSERKTKGAVFAFGCEPVQPSLGKLDRLRKYLVKLLAERFHVILMLHDKGQAERLQEILTDWEIDSFIDKEGSTDHQGSVGLTVGSLNQGFVLRDKQVALLTHSDIFLKSYAQHRVQGPSPKEPSDHIKRFVDLRRGDFVVHINHGIAVYGGIATKDVQGVTRDYLVLQYAGEDKLFVPIDQAERVTKYIGADANPPKVNKLTGNEWLRVKKRVNKSVKQLAIDLFNFYAARANASGFSFSPDTVWQAELEEAFPFEETNSQLEATADIKRDMEQPKPMDRLICGDVGYGKTEVAMRAAFKAAIDEKQVMVLVPTTILAEQHYKTFKSRFAPYPIIVEELSRFKSAREQARIVQKFQDGKIDILIGTHRLLQRDVLPKDLGLLIVDEEQRFGVGHKEHLKTLKKEVDALALTATPIPRTLQMSLSGIRDISIMDTPPENRYPISTYVGKSNQELMRTAIRREMSRGGQVYYVHNRVETIEGMTRFMEGIVPEARFAVAHGQMSERDLEKIMNDFLAQKYDVLVCTTIIESGIDIPSVNTLIVDKAERLGLSTLYQLRGRVGRAHHQAYAYFFFSPRSNLSSTASERLKTISEFTGLGSGLKIALRDLEIRGAGNLLGAEQHGQMASVGFELYCQMLNQAVQEIEGKAPEKVEVRIELPISAYIPHDYIEDETLRTEAYQRMASVQRHADVEEAARELQDRYGQLPVPVSNLLDIVRVRIHAQRRRITNIGWERKRLILSPIDLASKDQDRLKKAGWKFLYNGREKTLKVYNLSVGDIVHFLLKLFNDIIS
jgi:transcription-repair coupling factor (superfamily II helicase)